MLKRIYVQLWQFNQNIFNFNHLNFVEYFVIMTNFFMRSFLATLLIVLNFRFSCMHFHAFTWRKLLLNLVYFLFGVATHREQQPPTQETIATLKELPELAAMKMEICENGKFFKMF